MSMFIGDTTPDSRIVSLCLSLLEHGISRVVYDGSYEKIVFSQELGTVLNNMKQELSRSINNQDSLEFKKQTFIRLVNHLYTSDTLVQTQKLLPFLDSIVKLAFGNVKLTVLLEDLQNKLKGLSYSDTDIKEMQIYKNS